MATVQLKAEVREAGTKGQARRLRAAGKIPAILYGEGGENVPLSLEADPFVQLLRHISSGNQILDLEIAGRKGPEVKALIKDVQRHPVDSSIVHVDLQHISMTHKVRVHVPIHLTGSSIGVKEGGILEHLLRELEIECLPSEIPADVTVDVTELQKNHSIHVRDLSLPEHIHVHDAAERVVATVAGKVREELPQPAVPAEAPEGAAPEAAESPKGD